MTKAAQMVPRDLALIYTQRDGRSYPKTHRVWNADVFFAAMQDDARKAKGREGKEAQPSDVVSVRVA